MRIIGRKEKGATQIDAGRVGTRAEPSDDVADVDGEKAN
jgi:hypothetical protein